MALNHMRIKTKLMLGFICLAAVVLLVSGLALSSLTRANDRFSDYLEGANQRERMATAVRGAATRRAIAARNLVLVTQASDRELEKAAVVKSQQDMDEAVKNLRASVAPSVHSDATDEDRAMVETIAQVEEKYRTVAGHIVALELQGHREEAVAKMNAECRPLLAQLLKITNDFVEHEHDQAVARAKGAEQAYASDKALMLATCLAAIVAATAMGWLLSNGVTRPLNRAVKLAEAVAAGDLRSDIVVDRGDETGQLLSALKSMNDSLGSMVGQVRQAADSIAVASTEIATGNMDLSSRTEQQASALQQTAASMQHMTGTVQHNADSSRQASVLAASAADVAGRGGLVVERVVHTMGDISEASRKIADIIGVIDGIAFQTNILALNAAVEAARAGEQGRGFAVVAGEVRTLAQRSAQAAKEIKQLIVDSSEKVQAGSRLVDEAGTTMNDVVAQVKRMNDLIAEVNASTTEQSVGIGQVNQAVASLDHGTQQNAALVEESAAAAESLRQQAAALQNVIAAFKTRDNAPALAMAEEAQMLYASRPVGRPGSARPLGATPSQALKSPSLARPASSSAARLIPAEIDR
ncbi:HAMP domain-containing protein [Aquabacterium soli]|uniref:HAMP domain-containing protein n=1 Tax=Aquabacterium soli TaxID=2493092 RepID=A0A3R8S7L0_9BURK|nr:methyl-accepting chemotaxis protein [Aquabacterium soli]RRS04300.1 HAMP domain-containing protein [Aquabacterium soli]